jgi:molybdopterin synthase catalytic subunit
VTDSVPVPVGAAASARPRVRLTGVRETPIGADEVLAAVADPAAGGSCVFVGTVRDLDGGRSVTGLTYSAHPSASARLLAVCQEVADRHEIVAVAAVHRIGALAITDTAVAVAASAAHREQAFAAARDLIDTLKSTVPIWKQQGFADGHDEWVGLP